MSKVGQVGQGPKPDRRGAKKGVRQTHVRGQLGQPKPGSPPIEERVSTIFDLMVEKIWGTPAAPSEQELATRWAVSRSSVRAAAAEASRRERLIIDPEWVRSHCASALVSALGVAKGKPNQVARVVDSYASLVGASAPARLEHSGPGGKPMGLQVYPLVALPALEVDPRLPESSGAVASLPEAASPSSPPTAGSVQRGPVALPPLDVRVACRHGNVAEDCGLCFLDGK